MVKLGHGFAEKGAKQEDGFDTIPLMTPLDVNQLQFPPPEKVVVKTKADYEPSRKKGQGQAQVHKIGEFTFTVTESMLEKLKVALLVLIALAFLACIIFLVVYKVYKYDNLCPEGFTIKNNQCIPNGMAAYFVEQDPQSPDKVFVAAAHFDLTRKSHAVPPWMAMLTEEKVSEQETEAAEKKKAA